jgi:hypothetical protein
MLLLYLIYQKYFSSDVSKRGKDDGNWYNGEEENIKEDECNEECVIVDRSSNRYELVIWV